MNFLRVGCLSAGEQGTGDFRGKEGNDVTKKGKSDRQQNREAYLKYTGKRAPSTPSPFDEEVGTVDSTAGE